MDELELRILEHVRPLREVVAMAIAELEREQPGVIDRMEALVDHPHRELATRSDTEKKQDAHKLTVLRLARQWAAASGG